MKTFSLIILLILSSFVVSKDMLLQTMNDNLVKKQQAMPSNYYRYVRNAQVKIQIISKIIDKNMLSSLDKVGIPKFMAEQFKAALYAGSITTETVHSFDISNLKYEFGGAMKKGEKIRFTYFDVTVKAETIQQINTIVIPHKKRRKTWNEIKRVPRAFTTEEIKLIKEYLVYRAQTELMNKIKTLMEITSDGDNFLTDATVDNLKFLA